MEKILYPLWKRDTQSTASFGAQLLGPVTEQLVATGVRKTRLSLADEAVTRASSLRLQHIQPLMDAMLSLWVDSAIYRQRQETIIQAAVDHFHGYLVTESEPIVNTLHPETAGQRGYGFAQVVFLQRPDWLDYDEWLDIWQNDHTEVAINTQSTFAYRQNVVTRKLTQAGPDIDAIVEECFPPDAMDSPQVFFNAEGDAEKYQSNYATMIESSSRFIDFSRIDVIPSSEYLLSG